MFWALMCHKTINQLVQPLTLTFASLTVEHIFLSCSDMILYVINLLMYVYCKNFFEKTHSQHTLNFIKDIII